MKRNFTFFYKLTSGQRVFISLFFVLIVFIQPTNAQQDTTRKLKEVKVISLTLLNIQTITPVQQISNVDFGHYSAISVADVAANFAGVNLRDYGGIGGMKTISVRGFGANHAGVLYDGIELNDAQNGQVDLGRFSLNNVTSIALYNGQSPNIVQPARSFSAASLLDIKTVHPNLTPNKPYQIAIGLGAGSFGLFNPYLQWQQRISRHWSFIWNSNYTGANGQYKFKVHGDGSDTLKTRTNSDIKAYQTEGALYWAKSDSNRLKLQFNYYNSDRGLPGPVIFYVEGSNQRLQDHNILAQSTYEYIAQNSFHLLLSSKFSQNYQHYADPDYLNNNGGINEHYTEQEFYQSASIGYHLLPGWELSYAADATIAHLRSDVYQYAFPTRLSLLNVVATNIVFGKWRFEGNLLQTYISESVNSGVSANNHSVLSPTVIATFKPFSSNGFLLRAFYKDIFRNPTFSELYYYNVAPRKLKPEYAKQFNLGAVYQKSFNGIFKDIVLTADVYYNHIRDKIIYLPSRSPDIPSATNLGLVDIKGIDITAKTVLVPANGWRATFNANYTYQQVLDVTSPGDTYYLDQIPYTPNNLLALNAGVSHRQFGFYYNYTLSSSRYYQSDNTEANYLPAYGLSSASLIYNFLTNKLPACASFTANNLFNKDYVIVRSYPMPGRSYRFSIQITI